MRPEQSATESAQTRGERDRAIGTASFSLPQLFAFRYLAPPRVPHLRRDQEQNKITSGLHPHGSIEEDEEESRSRPPRSREARCCQQRCSCRTSNSLRRESWVWSWQRSRRPSTCRPLSGGVPI